jgi:sorting nexin-1/2
MRRILYRADFQYGQFSVIRRFKDFVWLSERLGEEFPGVINPPLPDKETLKRFDAEHIEKRRAELERYLARVAAHSELSGSAFFMTFLQVHVLHERQLLHIILIVAA